MITEAQPTGENDACAHACATCPWLKQNHGKPHPQKWYTTTNLKRLWNGIRRGEGMICHATDPQSIEYGGKGAQAGHERMCIGSLVLVIRSLRRLEHGDLKAYRAGVGLRMTKPGMLEWAGRIMMAGTPLGPRRQVLPAVINGSPEIGVPWPDDVLNVTEEPHQ
jgi:hypothetical protein